MKRKYYIKKAATGLWRQQPVSRPNKGIVLVLNLSRVTYDSRTLTLKVWTQDQLVTSEHAAVQYDIYKGGCYLKVIK